MNITITLAPSEAHLLLAVLDEARKGQAFPIAVYGAAGELQIGDMFARINEALRALRNPPVAELVDDDQADDEDQPAGQPEHDRQRLAALDLVLLEVMPRQHRAAHTEAGHRGRYPHNGAVRYLVPRDRALEVVAADPEWSEILRDATEADLGRYAVRQEVTR